MEPERQGYKTLGSSEPAMAESSVRATVAASLIPSAGGDAEWEPLPSGLGLGARGALRRALWLPAVLLAVCGALLLAHCGLAGGLVASFAPGGDAAAVRLGSPERQGDLASYADAGQGASTAEWAKLQEGRTIYAVGDDMRVYKQELWRMTRNSRWRPAATGEFLSLAIGERRLYGVGRDHKVYSLPLDAEDAGGSGNWTLASASHASWLAVSPGTGAIFKIGVDDLLYRQATVGLAPDSPWEGPLGASTRLRSIAATGDVLFGVGVDGKVYSASASAVGEADAWRGPISGGSNITAIAVFGDSALGVGIDGRVYRQTATDMWAVVGGGRVRSIAVTRPRARWLPSSPAWSRRGAAVAEAWASSVADDEFGGPDTEGPANLLSGGHWRCRWGEIQRQWMVLDLGRPISVEAVRVRGSTSDVKKNPRTVRWQAGDSLSGPWSDAVAPFEAPENGEAWGTARLEMPRVSRWWRLFVVDSWGNGGPGEDMLVVSGFGIKGYPVPQQDEVDSSQCSPGRFVPPPRPDMATDHNGVALRDVCFEGDGPHHVFVIGDWGGIVFEPGTPPRPADHRSRLFTHQHRPFVEGVDDTAQLRVAAQMQRRAVTSRPDYVLNMGDNFYWGGVTAMCGATMGVEVTDTGQWGAIFEDIYRGPGLDYVQWLGVLGNHDYGGFMFTSGWDQIIAYTWANIPSSTGRWVTPAQYWRSKVRYSDFSVDYFFLDTNVFDAFDPIDFVGHNLCSMTHNPANASCAPQGPGSIWACSKWFDDLWAAQTAWLERGLDESKAEWQVIVTHFPAEWGKDFWTVLARKYGVDLYVSGHTHHQVVFAPGEEGNWIGDTALLISGGGGGITSQETPDVDGEDDEYGFMDLTLSRESIVVEAISHGGQIRRRLTVRPRQREPRS